MSSNLRDGHFATDTYAFWGLTVVIAGKVDAILAQLPDYKDDGNRKQMVEFFGQQALQVFSPFFEHARGEAKK